MKKIAMPRTLAVVERERERERATLYKIEKNI